MKKVRVHIASDEIYMDNNVYVDLVLADIPRIGERVHLDDKSFQILHDKATSSLDIAKKYAPDWFYGFSCDCNDPTENNLSDLGFFDAQLVTGVAYYPGDEFVHIELDD